MNVQVLSLIFKIRVVVHWQSWMLCSWSQWMFLKYCQSKYELQLYLLIYLIFSWILHHSDSVLEACTPQSPTEKVHHELLFKSINFLYLNQGVSVRISMYAQQEKSFPLLVITVIRIQHLFTQLIIKYYSVVSTYLLYFSHYLIGVSGACRLHWPSEPQRSWFDLIGLVDNIGDVGLASWGHGSVHLSHGLSLAPRASNTQTTFHPTETINHC